MLSLIPIDVYDDMTLVT